MFIMGAFPHYSFGCAEVRMNTGKETGKKKGVNGRIEPKHRMPGRG